MRLTEEALPELSDCLLARVCSAIWRRRCVFEDTIVAHQLHHPFYIVTIESLIEFKHHAQRCFYL